MRGGRGGGGGGERNLINSSCLCNNNPLQNMTSKEYCNAFTTKLDDNVTNLIWCQKQSRRRIELDWRV